MDFTFVSIHSFFYCTLDGYEREASVTMCHFTYTFYECGHRVEDHIKQCDAAQRGERGSGHCDPDTQRASCTINVGDKFGQCPRCRQAEIRLLRELEEAEKMQKDLERARALAEEEQGDA